MEVFTIVCYGIGVFCFISLDKIKYVSIFEACGLILVYFLLATRFPFNIKILLLENSVAFLTGIISMIISSNYFNRKDE